MCDLCSGNPARRAAAEQEHRELAEDLERVAYAYRRLAAGTLKPHSEEIKKITPTVKKLLREFVNEWL
jgi:hypothetical protein